MPIDGKTGQPWSPEGSNRAFQHFKTLAVADLTARDVERGVAGEISVVTDAGMRVADPAKSRLRHTGAEAKSLWFGRWADFCAKPQDEQGFLASLPPSGDAQRFDRLRREAAEVEATLP